MFGRAERACRGRAGRGSGEGGFTLVEVVVAVGLLVVVLVALLPELVVGIRASAGAKNLTQAKGVLQARLEVMRSMPFHVGPAAGDYIDVLDTYYRDVSVPVVPATCVSGGVLGAPLPSWSGFVPAGTGRCSYEPPVGAFYRKVIPNITAPGLGVFTLVLDSAFLTDGVPPVVVPPVAGYASQTAGLDTPASGQLGVWATVVYRQSSGLKPVSTFTQVSRRSAASSSLEVNATVDTVRVASQSPFSLITLDAGVVAQSGARFTGSTVHVSANAASAGSGTGAVAEGARATLAAPATAWQAFTVAGWQGLNGSCQYVCVGPSSVGGASVAADNGLPLSASATVPVRVAGTSTVLSPGYSSAKNGGFSFNNFPDVAGLGFARGLRPDQPMVTVDGNAPGVSYAQSDCVSTGVAESGNYFSATGFLAADPVTDVSPSVRACVTARTGPIMLFPTSWAPRGVIRVTLDQSSLRCRVVRSMGVRSAAATVKFAAKVEYWNGSGYVTAGSVTQASGSDPLAGVDLTTTSVGNGFTLWDFIQSWSASGSADVSVVGSGSQVRAKVPGVVSIDSQPTRGGDPNSVVSVTVGTFTCDAKDVR